jgi:Ca2+-transporting ATPase
MVNVFNARSETSSIFKIGFFSNLWLLGAIAISIALTIMMTEIPFLQHYLGTTGLDSFDWSIVAASSILVLVVEEFRKVFARKKLAKA